ncbi:MAG: cytochrome b N-terminal domain-containing protein [Myxococcales bacterium]|nr:cytochrome b N-terminal domain-containing protein [Myxococcales bacterium]
MLAWLEERTAVPGLVRRLLDHPVPGGPRLRYVLPAVLVYLLAQQCVLGVLMAAHYSPSASDAWASTVYLNDQLASGWFLRGLHHYGTSAMILTAVAYLVQLALTGEYRRPREMIWISTLGLLVVTMALGVTGNILPWDEQGYWAAQVELGIMEQTPGGEALRTVVQGGSEAGNLTLTRLFTLHAFVLPLVAAALVAGIVVLGRRSQAAEAAQDPGRAQAFGSGQLLIDVIAMALVAGALVAMTVSTHGSELYAPADPTSGFQARPEWYFLFLYKLRMFFEGPMEPVATMVIPGAAAVMLVVAPFVDALAGRVGRIGVLVVLGLMMAGVVGLTALSMTSDAGNESYQKALAQANTQAERARGFAKEGVLPEGGPAVFRNDPEYKVRALFVEHCQNCHELDGLGGQEAPSLTDYSSRAWLAALVRDPNAERFFGGTKHSDMDAYPETTDDDEVTAIAADQLDALVEYLWQLQGEADVDTTLAAAGKTLWEDELDCNGCHEIAAGAEGSGPNLRGHASVDWVARVIRDSSKPDLFGDEAQMPKFGEDKLDDDQLQELAAFVVRQRGGEPAEAEAE